MPSAGALGGTDHRGDVYLAALGQKAHLLGPEPPPACILV